MKKSSQIALGGSLVLFLAAGTVKFWPEDRFSPTPANPQAMMGGVPLGLRSFGPGWAESASLPRAAGMAQPTGGGRAMSDPASPLPQQPGSILPRPPLSPAPSDHGSGVRVSLAAQNMPVGVIFSRLFHQAGVSFAPTDKWNEPMTITISDEPLAQAVGRALSLTTQPRLTCRLENEVYVIRPISLPPSPFLLPAR